MNTIEIMAAAFADELEKLASVKEAGMFSSVGNWMAQKGATAAPAAGQAAQAAGQVAGHVTPTVAQAGAQAATKNPSALRKAAPYLAAAGAGAIGFQQLRKASKDWETGRAMRLQQEAYSPT